MNKQFEGILDRYFEATLEDHPVLANFTGLRRGEGKLDKATPDFERKQHQRRLVTLAQLDGVSPRELSNEQQLDRLALRGMLLRECEDHDRRRASLEPDAPERLMNVLLHELIRGDDEPKRAATNIRSLLDKTPRFLDEAITLIDRPEPVWLKIMRQTSAGAPTLFSAVETFLKKSSPEPKDRARISSAQRAIKKYCDKVEARQTAAPDSFAIGPEAMQRRVRDELGLDYTLDEASGSVVAGSQTEPTTFEEFWTFTREVGPNPWRVTAIQQPSA